MQCPSQCIVDGDVPPGLLNDILESFCRFSMGSNI